MELNDELLSAYIDDALDEGQRVAVAQSLQSDPGARIRLQRMREADQALREAMPLPTGDYLDRAMKERLALPSASARAQSPWLQWALAASLAGLAVGYILPHSSAGTGSLDRNLVRALDAATAGAANGAGTQILLTFEAADGRYCRLFRSGGSLQGEGLACRDDAGWKLAAWDASVPEATEGFRTAGASALVDGAMTALGGKPAMSAEEEKQLIDRKWRKP